MKYQVDINFPEERILKNRLRFQTYNDFKYFDRPPVLFGVFTRYYLEVFGINYDDYFKDAKSQFEWQLKFQKWAIENLPDDRCQSKSITVAPDFENVHNSAGFGAPVVFTHDNPPRVEEFIHTPEEADAWQPSGIKSEFWKMFRGWWQTMADLAGETQVTFNGEPGEIIVAPLGTQMIGPFMCAVEMVGTQFYEWLYYYPEVCHRLLDKITNSLIETEEEFRKIDPRPRTLYGLAEDDAGNISNDYFKEFSVPYDLRLYEKFGKGLRDGRSMHNCGRSVHLLDTYIDDLKISTFSLFGYSVTPETVAQKLAGKCYLWGNINPIMLADEDKEAIAVYSRKYFDLVAPYGGIVFGDGANVTPDTPVDNMELVVRVAEEYAKDHPEIFTDDIDKFIVDNKIEVGATGKAFTI